MIDVTIPLRTPTLNEWQRMHFGKRKRVGKDIAWAIRAELRPSGEPMKRCRITIERTSTQAPDHDGLIGGLKPLLDALQPASKRHPYGLGLIEDDGPGCVVELRAIHVAGKATKTRILIEGVASGDC